MPSFTNASATHHHVHNYIGGEHEAHYPLMLTCKAYRGGQDMPGVIIN
jgi:hypothetical protein